MPEAIPIRERILRQLRTNAATITGIGTVRRWDTRAKFTPIHLDAVVAASDETAEEGPQGTIGYTDKTLPVVVAVILFQSEASDDDSDWLRNRWQARLEQKLMANPAIIEAVTNQRLAIDTQISLIDGPDYAEGSLSAAVQVDVTYRHDRNSPYTWGTLITQQTE